MTGLVVFSLLFALSLVIGMVVYVIYIIRNFLKSHKKLNRFLENSAKVQKGQNLDKVIELLGDPSLISEIDNHYLVKWQVIINYNYKIEEKSITIICDKNNIVTEVARDNLD